MAFFSFGKSGERKGSSAEGARPRPITHAESAAALIHFEDKREPNDEELKTLKEAEEDTAAFLEDLGFSEAAEKIRGFVDKGKIFFFTQYVKEKPFGGEDYRIEPAGFFSREHEAIGIREDMFSYGGHPAIYAIAVHELIHLASFFSGEEGLRSVDHHWGTGMRAQAGFDVNSYPLIIGKEAQGMAKEHFVSLNEGMTETMTSMLEPSNWNQPDGYHVQRYLVQVLLRAMVNQKRIAKPDYSLRDAWKLIATDYFNNTFHFVKEVDSLFGKGTSRELARLVPIREDDTDEIKEEKIQLETKFLARIGTYADLPCGPEELAELRESRRGGNMLALVKRLQDETYRAARSIPPQRLAA